MICIKQAVIGVHESAGVRVEKGANKGLGVGTELGLGTKGGGGDITTGGVIVGPSIRPENGPVMKLEADADVAVEGGGENEWQIGAVTGTDDKKDCANILDEELH